MGWSPTVRARLERVAPASHSFLYVGNGELVEGWQSGARRRAVSEYPNAVWLTRLSAGLTGAQRIQVVTYAVQHLNTPYSWLDDAEIGFVELFGKAPKWLRSQLRSERHMMCSQLCDAAYTAAGVDLFRDGRPAGAVSPMDLWRADQGAAKRA
jgi:uncharacterized protein YycO